MNKRSLMGNKSKQDQSGQRIMNDYEKSRLLRVQENQARLQELGVKNIAKSLTSLVESRKKKTKKVQPTCTNARDVDYIPDMGDDNEGDYQEVATSVEVSKKQHRPQYVAPMSMNRLANLAKKHRVIAPNVSQKFPLDPNTTKEKQSRETITMGELILNNKGSQRQSNVAKTNCITRGAKRQLVLVDEHDDSGDDDDEEDEICQDINMVDMDEDGLSDDENEGVIRRTQEDDVDQDDEYEDMNHMTLENDENEIQGEYSDNDLEIEDDVLVQEQLEVPELEKETAISKLKKRGPTMMHDVHTRKLNERETIICNEFGQPVGPVSKEKDVVGRFSLFLGTIARNHSYAPLTHKSWHKVPNKDKIWEYVLEKYDVPDVARTWVLQTIGHDYKVHKCRFKKKHFYQFKDNKTRWKNRPKSIPEKDFSQLLNLWNNKNVAKRCLRAKEIRMSQKNMHTVGPKSFARIRDEMKNEDPNKELPTLTQMFERTRKRTEGRAYVDSYDDTARKIEQMKNYKPLEDGSASIDPFMVVMNKEHDGYRRLYGRGVTNRLLKKMDGGDTSYMISGGLMETFKENVEVEKSKLLEMRKEIEEDHERKKAELESMRKDIVNQREDFEAMRKDLEKQRVTFEATVRKLMTQLPLGGGELQI